MFTSGRVAKDGGYSIRSVKPENPMLHALSLWVNMVCGRLERLLVHGPEFNQVIWVKNASAYAFY